MTRSRHVDASLRPTMLPPKGHPAGMGLGTSTMSGLCSLTASVAISPIIALPGDPGTTPYKRV